MTGALLLLPVGDGQSPDGGELGAKDQLDVAGQGSGGGVKVSGTCGRGRRGGEGERTARLV